MDNINEGIDFQGVEAAKSTPMTMPGTIGLFNISEVEFTESKTKRTPNMKVTFSCEKMLNEKGELVDESSSFNHAFYLSAEALKRLQYLALTIFGSELSGKLTPQSLTAKFTSQRVALKVSGQVGNNGKGYPDLSYAGFGQSAGEFLTAPTSKLKFSASERNNIADALEALKSSRSANADSEGGAPSGTAAGKAF